MVAHFIFELIVLTLGGLVAVKTLIGTHLKGCLEPLTGSTSLLNPQSTLEKGKARRDGICIELGAHGGAIQLDWDLGFELRQKR